MEYQSEITRKYVAQGRTGGYIEWFIVGYFVGHAEGFFKAVAHSVLKVLEVRGLAVPGAIRERILAQKDRERLERWLEKAAVASSADAVVDETN